MDLLDIVKDKVEPDYVNGQKDKGEERVAKRTKVFLQQVQKGVVEMQVIKSLKMNTIINFKHIYISHSNPFKETLLYQPGRSYSKEHVKKRKAKKGVLYHREVRNLEG